MREYHTVGLYKVILANQLFSPADMKEIPTSVNILHQCKIGKISVSHKKIKTKHYKDNKCKVKKEIMIDLLSLNSSNDSKTENNSEKIEIMSKNI